MAYPKTSNCFLEWKKARNGDPGESQNTEHGSSFQSTILEIEQAERARCAAVTEQIHTMIASQQAHSNTVLQRLRRFVEQDVLPPPQPPACLRRNPESSLRAQRIRHISRTDENNRSQTSIATLWPEAKDAQLWMNPTDVPTPPQTPLTRGVSRLPVKTAGAGKKVVDGYTLQSATPVLEKTMKKFEQFQLKQLPSARLPQSPNVKTFVPAPPSAAAAKEKRGPRHGTTLRHLKTEKYELPPVAKTSDSLSFCFRQLNSEDWEKKMKGLQIIQDLARHHPEQLQTKLHEICLAVTEEVKNLRSAVACAAMDTIAELYICLGKAMDSQAERTGRALLLKLATTTNAFINQRANHALDTLVDVCSPDRVVSTLFNTGIRHRNSAVRGSTAQHFHQLMDIIGEDQILKLGNTFAERFVSAICLMSVDAAPDVRNSGQKMLRALAFCKEFRILWKKVIPIKDRPALEKILKKMRQ